MFSRTSTAIRSSRLPLFLSNPPLCTPLSHSTRFLLPHRTFLAPKNLKPELAVNNLLYNIPNQKSPKSTRRTLCALVSNESGVLSRVAGCLAGRGFNIDSLVVSETETHGLSRMTIVLNGTEADVIQARKQLEDLVQVWAVVEFSPFAAVVERELLLIKLNIKPQNELSNENETTETSETYQTHPSTSFYTKGYPTAPSEAMAAHVRRQAIVELTNLFQGRVLDLTSSFIMIELTGKSVKIDAFIELVKPFGIRELARSGTLAMLRGQITSVDSRDKTQETEQKTTQIDESMLPPG